MYLDWELSPDLIPGEGYYGAGSIVSAQTLSYQAPSIYRATLDLNNSNVAVSDPQNYSVVTFPSDGYSGWITFEGSFGLFPDVVSVTYSDETEVHACVTTENPYSSGSAAYLLGEISSHRIVCRTATGEGEGYYRITVDVAGQSDVSHDILVFPAVPLLHWISGCDSNGIATQNCETEGGTVLTLAGVNFFQSVVSLLS